MGDESKGILSVEDFLAGTRAGPATLAQYRRQYRILAEDLGKPLAEATPQDLRKLKQKLQEMKSGHHKARLLRMYFNAAGMPQKSALLKVTQPKHRLPPSAILEPSEIQAMVEKGARSLRDRALLGTIWETGGRIHELLSLRLKDVKRTESPENNGRMVFVLWFSKVKVAGEEHEGYVVEMAPVLDAWLKAHPHPQPEAFVFESWAGRGLHRSKGWAIVHAAARRAGIQKRVFPHLFRHSRATYLLRLGMPEGQVKKLLGWAPGSTMLNRYQHLTDRDAYRALLKAQGLVPPEPLDLGRIAIKAEDLQPVVAMNPPPGGFKDETQVLRAEVVAMEARLENMMQLLGAALSQAPGKKEGAEGSFSELVAGIKAKPKDGGA